MGRWLWRSTVVAVVVLVVLAAAVAAATLLLSDTALTAARFARLAQNHTALRAFLNRMPKGGDLHVHLSGAVYAERLIAWASEDGLCLHSKNFSIVECKGEDTERIVDVLSRPNPYDQKVQDIYDRVVNALSMRWFRPSPAVASGHDQFFASFGKFSAATKKRFVDMVIDQLDHYAAEQVQYVEFMSTFLNSDERDKLIAALGSETNPEAMLNALKRGGLDGTVAAMRERLDMAMATIDARLACNAPQARPGCAVSYRHIAQINRNSSPESVFVQTAAAAALVRADPRVVAFNFVAPEDYRTALRDYREHMRTIAFLAGKDVPVALHAGELWLGLVPPGDLTFHIRDAIEVAGAKRIGHGVALAFERDMNGLLAGMRKRDVAVEINLTSNDAILGVRGKDHPLPAYLAAGVPVVLSTDDAGVSRIDMTNEYFRAARDYALDYQTLRAIARNSLEYSFMSKADKDAALARLASAVAKFERSIAGETWRDRVVGALRVLAGDLIAD